jgi:hypothetical protein
MTAKVCLLLDHEYGSYINEYESPGRIPQLGDKIQKNDVTCRKKKIGACSQKSTED